MEELQEQQINIPEPAVDLTDLLSQYNKPATEDLPPVQEESSTVSDSETLRIQASHTDTGEVKPTGWEGNPLYYQTGKKAGTLRPGGKRSPSQQADPDPVLMGEILDGETLVLFIDMVIPALMELVNNMVSPVKVNSDNFDELTTKQEKLLIKLCDKASQRAFIKADPMWMLLIALVAIYGMKFMTARMEAKQELKFNEQKQTIKTGDNQNG